MPAVYPSITPELLNEWRTLLANDGYAALAAEVLKLFVDDIPERDLEDIAKRAYRTPVFASEEIVPVTRLNADLHIGHLSEGPTAAFKDMAMQLLGELFEYELGRRGEEINILGATSGDTGSSAEYAMRGRDNIRVFMLTPAGRMTPFQQAQMFGLDDPNIFNIALAGVFDDCQDVVKEVHADAAFNASRAALSSPAIAPGSKTANAVPARWSSTRTTRTVSLVLSTSFTAAPSWWCVHSPRVRPRKEEARRCLPRRPRRSAM